MEMLGSDERRKIINEVRKVWGNPDGSFDEMGVHSAMTKIEELMRKKYGIDKR